MRRRLGGLPIFHRLSARRTHDAARIKSGQPVKTDSSHRHDFLNTFIG